MNKLLKVKRQVVYVFTNFLVFFQKRLMSLQVHSVATAGGGEKAQCAILVERAVEESCCGYRTLVLVCA